MKETSILIWIAIIVAMIVVGPLLTIWALNTLFPALTIPYTFETWCAVVIVGGVFKTNISRKE